MIVHCKTTKLQQQQQSSRTRRRRKEVRRSMSLSVDTCHKLHYPFVIRPAKVPALATAIFDLASQVLALVRLASRFRGAIAWFTLAASCFTSDKDADASAAFRTASPDLRLLQAHGSLQFLFLFTLGQRQQDVISCNCTAIKIQTGWYAGDTYSQRVTAKSKVFKNQSSLTLQRTLKIGLLQFSCFNSISYVPVARFKIRI